MLRMLDQVRLSEALNNTLHPSQLPPQNFNQEYDVEIIEDDEEEIPIEQND